MKNPFSRIATDGTTGKTESTEESLTIILRPCEEQEVTRKRAGGRTQVLKYRPHFRPCVQSHVPGHGVFVLFGWPTFVQREVETCMPRRSATKTDKSLARRDEVRGGR